MFRDNSARDLNNGSENRFERRSDVVPSSTLRPRAGVQKVKADMLGTRLRIASIFEEARKASGLDNI